VPVYAPGFPGTYCTYSQRDGWAELIYMVGCIKRWFTDLHCRWSPI